MAVDGGMRFIKYLLFIFNFCFTVIGAVLIGVGVSTKAGWNETYFAFIKSSSLSTPPNLLIAVGIFIFVIAFLGCCGAIKENHCMMMSYSVLVGLILVLQLGAAFAAFALKDDVRQVVSDGLQLSQKGYGNDTEQGKEMKAAWDVMQNSLGCCGTDNFTDWKDIVHHNNASILHANFVPESCCKLDSPNCTANVFTTTGETEAEKTIYVNGCLEKAIHEFAVGTLGIIALVLAIVELLGVLCACFLARSIRYSYETV